MRSRSTPPRRRRKAKTPANGFKAYGFDVQEIDGQDMQQFLDALNMAKRRDNGKPQFIIAHTLIGKGIPEVAGTYKAHGEAGAKYVDAARKALGLPEEHYFVSQEVYDYFAEHKKKLLADYDRWEKTYSEWRKKNPDKAKMLDDGFERKVPADLLSKIPDFPKDAKLATRKAGSEVLQPIAQAMPLLMSGSADLHGSTLNYIKDGGDFTRDNPGRAQHPVRHSRTRDVRDSERHLVSRTLPRIWRDLHWFSPIIAARPFGSPRWQSFPIFTFSLTIRSASAKTVPTHEPVETVSSVRLIPHIDVIRPADPEETAGAFVAADGTNRWSDVPRAHTPDRSDFK